ncbi:MAG: HAMP domain-containing histidine kinase [Clostridia bacterium]|nr:HAMP domain-containing histidine kinase [Clostridia bacterium]
MKSKFVFGIRAKFIAAFLISLLAGLIAFMTINGIIRNNRTDYSPEIEGFKRACRPIVEEITANYPNQEKLQKIINDNFTRNNAQIETFIADKNGIVFLKPYQNPLTKLDLDLIKRGQDNYEYQGNRIRYSKVESLPDGNQVVFSGTIIKEDVNRLGFIGIIVFIITFFLLTYSRVNYIKVLANSLVEISKGNLSYKVKIKGKDELTLLAENINLMTGELNTRKQKEAQAEKMKTELIVNMSHDLRTPLTSIMGYTQLLKEKYTGEDEIKDYIRIIDEKAQRLGLMIQDLFEYTALTNCDVSLQKAQVSMNELVRQVVEGLMPVASLNDTSIAYGAPDQEILVQVDAEKLVRVFENILNNAIKYSEKPGNVDVSIFCDRDRTIVSIYNKGRTLSQEEQDMVFERFYRTDEARNSETGGTGIGLSIAKSIVELHGGEIWVECDPEGICFKVAL